MWRAVPGAMTGAALGLAAWTAAATAEPVPQMTVAGEAEVTAVPDLAQISLGAQGRGDTAIAAMNATSAALDGVLSRLTALGVEETDIQTRGLSVRERTRWDSESDREVFLGYEASNLIVVRVRDMDLLSQVLSEVLTEGANRLNNLSFQMQDPAPLRAEARRLAVTDAVEKAALYAEAAGVRVGRVLSITDSAAPMVEGPLMRTIEPAMVAEAPAAAVPVAIGEVTTRAEVTMIFEILQ
jgi:uncharacterized protein YggE